MVKDHSDRERGNLLLPGFFYMYYPTDRIAHTTAFVTPVVTSMNEVWCNFEGSKKKKIVELCSDFELSNFTIISLTLFILTLSRKSTLGPLYRRE